ncbi:putative F-box protein [Prunus yedoensis var. nudiflora]|uniref:Putative F-box protein n=1 Tax=Prunus yedoensis var. nudiflora TaxID=2094558 RepID=A0A314UPC6_PRUYE|nr:putative F-box protein [Prunus yedoensis var. nudiflora]
MLVLEEVKEHKWSRKQIPVPSEFLKDQNFPNRKASKFILCDMERQIIKKVMYLENGKKYLTSMQYKPSLIALKGMQSERAGVEVEL